jgi:SAM-dependent methyltransferase
VKRAALRAGTWAHYEDPALYDHTYKRRKSDVRYYADLAEAKGGPVLELGAGTGRVAMELARRGLEVVAVDAMDAMLNQAATRLQRQPRAVRERVTLVRGDLRRIDLGRRFPLVLAPFNVLMHLYDQSDMNRALANVRRHLRRTGRFAFDVRMPDARELGLDPDRLYRCGTVTHPETKRRYLYRENFRYDPVRQIQLITFVYQAEDDPNDVRTVPLTHRHFFPEELLALLDAQRFAVEARYGDFDGTPLDACSESQILVARPTERTCRATGDGR